MLAQVEKKVDCFVLFCFLDLHKKRLLSVFSSLWNSTELSFYCVCCGAYVALHFSLKGVGFKSGNVLGQVTGFLLQKLLSDCDCDRHLISQCYDVSTCVYEAGMS